MTCRHNEGLDSLNVVVYTVLRMTINKYSCYVTRLVAHLIQGARFDL